MKLKLYEPQPAHLMYAFKGGWNVMAYVKDNVFAATSTEAQAWTRRGDPSRDKARTADSMWVKYWLYSLYVGFVLAGWSQYISAMFVVSVFVALQFVVLTALMILSGVLIGLLAGGNFLYSSAYRIFNRCPLPDCYAQMPVATYVCPNCATEHTRLWPSMYGVFHHRCETCNTKLPTLDLLGRNKLTKKCATCGRPIGQEVGKQTDVHIPVVGGPSTGKSNLMITAVDQFIKEYSPEHKMTAEFGDPRNQERFAREVRDLSAGNALGKTPDVTPWAYTLSVKDGRRHPGHLLYLYDAAGEAYLSEDQTLLQTYYAYVHGIIFVIDPFSIPAIRAKYEAELAHLDELRPSTLDLMEAYERMLRVIEAAPRLTRGSKFAQPLAVVISKCDALDLEQQIGEPAAADLMGSTPAFELPEDAMSELVERFLCENGMENFVRNLQLQFEKVRYFSCSALGRMPGTDPGQPFKPQRAIDPLLWMLGQLNVISLKKERAAQIEALRRNGKTAPEPVVEKLTLDAEV